MILKLLGIFDILAGISLILLNVNLPLMKFVWIFAIYLIIKGIVFIKDIGSLIDLVAGIFIILAIYNILTSFSWIFVIWLIGKGFFSLMS